MTVTLRSMATEFGRQALAALGDADAHDEDARRQRGDRGFCAANPSEYVKRSRRQANVNRLRAAGLWTKRRLLHQTLGVLRDLETSIDGDCPACGHDHPDVHGTHDPGCALASLLGRP